jgi:phosphoribosylglycinamide formyltransferase-1
MNRTLGVLISGRGSNLQAILDAITSGRLDANIALVISNRGDVAGLERAKNAGIDTLVLDHRGRDRKEYDLMLIEELKKRNVKLVCLAGFMRILGPSFIQAFPNAILNIHPSLLPAFPGTDAQGQAVRHGVKISGVTVHLVTTELDAGPIVAQASVTVKDDDTPDALAARILVQEHQIYPEAISLVLDGAWQVVGRRFVRSGSASNRMETRPNSRSA